jgi:hypothetical protein
MIIKQPDCRVIIFNYDDREGSDLAQPKLFFQYKEVDVSSDIMSVSTSKAKMSPSGQFNLTLAPTRNWVAEISSGSWIAIFIDNKTIPDLDLISWKKDSLKWIGRIDTVRASRSMDQTSGAYLTQYSVAGRDWCASLESFVYIDPIASETPSALKVSPFNSAFGQSTRLAVDSKALKLYEKGLPSSSDVADGLFDIWGKQGSSFKISAVADKETTQRFTPYSPFNIPIRIPVAMGKAPLPTLSDAIDRQHGILVGPGKYERNTESVGAIDIRIMLGINTLWQVLQGSATVGGINEIYGDLAFNGDSPSMTLYKRVRPFSLQPAGLSIQSLSLDYDSLSNAIAGKSSSNDIKSSFFYLPKTYIDPENIISVDAGTNWSDVVNFIEILPDLSMWHFLKQPLPVFKIENATFNISSYAISGFKPMKLNVNFFPPKDGGTTPDINGLKNWLPVLKEWYFDTHKMLNGTITFSGQSGHIAVGDNIIFPAGVVADGSFIATSGIPSFGGDSDPYILAHVESVSNAYSKQPDGSTSFMTTVQFVRGVITDSKGSGRKSDKAYGIDSSRPSEPRSNKNTYGV